MYILQIDKLPVAPFVPLQWLKTRPRNRIRKRIHRRACIYDEHLPVRQSSVYGAIGLDQVFILDASVPFEADQWLAAPDEDWAGGGWAVLVGQDGEAVLYSMLGCMPEDRV